MGLGLTVGDLGLVSSTRIGHGSNASVQVSGAEIIVDDTTVPLCEGPSPSISKASTTPCAWLVLNFTDLVPVRTGCHSRRSLRGMIAAGDRCPRHLVLDAGRDSSVINRGPAVGPGRSCRQGVQIGKRGDRSTRHRQVAAAAVARRRWAKPLAPPAARPHRGRQVPPPEALVATLLSAAGARGTSRWSARASRVNSRRMSAWWTFCPRSALGHDRQQGPQRRAGVVDLAVLEILAGDALLGLGDVLHAVGEGVQVLRFGPEESSSKTRWRVVEDSAEERADELGGDPIAEAAGEHRSAGVVEVAHRLQVALSGSGTRGRARGRQAGTRSPGPAG